MNHRVLATCESREGDRTTSFIVELSDDGWTRLGNTEGNATIRLEPGWPNPFRSNLSISFFTPTGGPARLDLVDTSGRVVAQLIDRDLNSGRYFHSWKGHTIDGRPLPTGVYVLRLHAGGSSQSAKVIHIR